MNVAGQPGEQLGLHGNDGASLEPEGLVGAATSRTTRTLAGTASVGEANPLDDGVQDVRERVPAAAVPDYPYQPEVGVSLVVLEPMAARLLPRARRVTLLTSDLLKSESGRSDPPRRREQRRQKEANMEQRVRGIPLAPPGVRGPGAHSQNAQLLPR